MDLVSGEPFWPLKSGLLSSYPPLEASTTCDVIVLGAGITGALTAFHLAEAGVSVVVVDKRDVARGSTSASTSLLQYEIDVPLYRLSKMHGENHASRAYRRCRSALDSLEKIDRRLGGAGHFKRTQSFQGASRPAHISGLRREYEARKRHGFRVQLWSKRDVAAASDLPYPAALISADAAQIDAYRLTHALLASAARRGVRIYDRTHIVRRHASKTGVCLETSEGRTLRAKWLVVATGYETAPYLKEGLTKIVSTYALVTEPLPAFPGWPQQKLIWETAHPYIYLRTTSDHRVIIGGYDEPFQDARRRDALLPRKQGALERRLHQLLPQLKARRAYAWTGSFAETPDGLPYIGHHPDVPRTFFALGYGGNGITFSLIAAEIFRDLVCEGTCRDADLFTFDRRAA